MSNWLDTVMSDDELDIVSNNRRAQIAKQAEISFKAGIREVVEYVEGRKTGGENPNQVWLGEEWQAKLKEWFKDSPELLEKWGIK